MGRRHWQPTSSYSPPPLRYISALSRSTPKALSCPASQKSFKSCLATTNVKVSPSQMCSTMGKRVCAYRSQSSHTRDGRVLAGRAFFWKCFRKLSLHSLLQREWTAGVSDCTSLLLSNALTTLLCLLCEE